MKIKLSKNQWEYIGQKTNWLKQSSKESASYKDKDKTLTIIGPGTFDPNFNYNATIKDELGTIEAVTEGTLKEIYLWAKDHNFSMPQSIKELQEKQI